MGILSTCQMPSTSLSLQMKLITISDLVFYESEITTQVNCTTFKLENVYFTFSSCKFPLIQNQNETGRLFPFSLFDRSIKRKLHFSLHLEGVAAHRLHINQLASNWNAECKEVAFSVIQNWLLSFAPLFVLLIWYSVLGRKGGGGVGFVQGSYTYALYYPWFCVEATVDWSGLAVGWRKNAGGY